MPIHTARCIHYTSQVRVKKITRSLTSVIDLIVIRDNNYSQLINKTIVKEILSDFRHVMVN